MIYVGIRKNEMSRKNSLSSSSVVKHTLSICMAQTTWKYRHHGAMHYIELVLLWFTAGQFIHISQGYLTGAMTTSIAQSLVKAESTPDICLFHGLSRSCLVNMMTSSNGNIFRVTGLLCGEFTGHRWIPRTKANDAELWCFLWSQPETTVEQTMETPVIWDATALIMTSL